MSCPSPLLLHCFPDFSSLLAGLWRSSPGWEPEPEQQPAETGAVQEPSQAIPHWIPGGHLEGNKSHLMYGFYSVKDKLAFCMLVLCLCCLHPFCPGSLDCLKHLGRLVGPDVLTLTFAFIIAIIYSFILIFYTVCSVCTVSDFNAAEGLDPTGLIKGWSMSWSLCIISFGGSFLHEQ